MRTPEPYLLSFTAASLSLAESLTIAETYNRLQDWDAVREAVLTQNLLHARTRSSLRRKYVELARRLQTLNDEQLLTFVSADPQTQRQLLWLAVCKRYAYIREFAVEVVREKFLRMEMTLSDYDYDAFFNRKADWHEELDEITTATKKKIKQVLFLMLQQAEIITRDRTILPAIFSEQARAALQIDAPMSFQIFPTSVTGE